MMSGAAVEVGVESSISGNKKIKLVALDLDGTTLNSHHELSQKTIETLRRFSAAGVVIAIATGRSSNSVLDYLSVLQLPQQIVPVVCFNGGWGLCVNQETGDVTTIVENPINLSAARLLIEFTSKRGLCLQYYNGATGDVQAVPVTEEHHELMARYAQIVGRKQVVLSSYDEAIAKSLPAKMLVFTSDADALMADAAAQLPPDTFNMIRGSPWPFFVEFLAHGISKASAIEGICSKLGIPTSDIAAFGDGENDKEMLALAGYGVAMNNAKQAAKDAAKIVIEWTNDDDGVAKQLEAFEQQGLL
jgi:Cof subfamily protein (haloacid dehalogenase superfamily)